MSKILREIRSKVRKEHIAISCTRHGCSTKNVPPNALIIDMDKVVPDSPTTDTHCDYVIFHVDTRNILITAPLELKSGGVGSVTDVHKQLQQGAAYAENLTPKDREPTCRPILFYGKRIDKAHMPKLNRLKIRFRGKKFTIDKARCGSDLTQALKCQ